MPSKLQLLASVLIHAMIAVAWFGPVQLWQSLSFQEHASTPPEKHSGGTRFVTKIRHSEPEKRSQPKVASPAMAKTELPPAEKPKTIAAAPRREYAGAPPAAQAPPPVKEPAAISTALTAHAPGSPAVSTDDHSSESALATTVMLSHAPDRKRVMAADQPRTEGDKVPIIDAIGLSSDGIDDIVSAGLGLLLMECDSQAVGSGVQRYIAKGSVKSPTQLIPVASNELHDYSERALHLPSTECDSLRKQLKADYAIAEPQLSRSRCFLLFTNRFDQQIYAAQSQAASSVGARLDELAVTTGRFEYDGAEMVFRITSVTRQDGYQPKLLNGGP